MQIRFMGSRDLVERIAKLTGQNSKIFSNRGGDEVRFFVQLDDSQVASWLELLENVDSPIPFDPRDFTQ